MQNVLKNINYIINQLIIRCVYIIQFVTISFIPRIIIKTQYDSLDSNNNSKKTFSYGHKSNIDTHSFEND